ncbi:PAS domain-containing sensor histidine kinase [Stutzerimonas stutzeri]|uniref:histidine kinase n=1 Tax=Stutzerimonas stutzeri TaxID=316 RepID=A0A6I6LKH2_STUST|nr:HWE histidine kinase domain-containing protein [Stutzerimonas stutzeri]QGZ31349.1 PAS domain-containing protein [Stutzerimonas stutzeri]
MLSPDSPDVSPVVDTPGRPLSFDDALLDMLPIGVCSLDADGAVLRYNRIAEQICGDAIKAYGRLRILCSDGTEWAFDDTPLADAIRTGRPSQDIALLIDQPDRGPTPVLANIQAVRNGTGAVTGAIVCFQANTPARQCNADRRRSVEWLSAIVENTPECVKVVDHDGVLVQMNPAGLRMLDAKTPEQVEGQCVFDVIAPEHRDYWRAQHQRVCGGEKLNWEFDIISLGGTRRHMETHAVPMAMPQSLPGAPRGFVQLAVTRDITDRKRLEAATREAERRLANLLDALPSAVYTTDASGTVTYFNQACVELAGRVPEIGADEWCVTWRLHWPDGTPMPHETCPMAVALLENRAIHGAEAVAERPDGTRVPFLAYPTPLRNGAGELVGAVNMLVDITERKVAEDRRQLLLNELNHRVKNTLATVQSIAAQSFRRDEISDGYRWFEGRLIALSRAHDVLSRESWQAARLNDIVDQVVAPFQANGRHRFVAEGPVLRLRPKAALALSMALHELCTNAAKFGALVSEEGQVRIQWQVAPGASGECVRLHWKEVGGPPVSPPLRRGFGSRLLEYGLAGELDAHVRLAYPLDGVACDIEVPLP